MEESSVLERFSNYCYPVTLKKCKTKTTQTNLNFLGNFNCAKPIESAYPQNRIKLIPLRNFIIKYFQMLITASRAIRVQGTHSVRVLLKPLRRSVFVVLDFRGTNANVSTFIVSNLFGSISGTSTHPQWRYSLH